jgi:hypothetical protein
MTDPDRHSAPGAAGPPAANDDAQSEDCALVVAIGNYRELTPLRGPGPDAIRFVQWLREKGGLKDENIALVDANEPGKPVNTDIRDALIRLGVRMNKRRGRRLYFYYAGHGLGPTFNEVAMVPADAAQDMLESACFGLNHCIDFFVKTGFFDELVVFMDCCREREEVPTIGLPFKFERRFEGGKEVNHFVLMAAGDGAKSFEVRDLTPDEERRFRGLMTTALIEGLNGAAGAIDSNNNVTSASLSHYVAKRVEEEAKALALPQAIDKPKPPREEIIFFRVPAAQVPTVRLRMIVGPKSAGQPIMIQNLKTGVTITEQPRQQGEAIEVILAGNARYQMIIPGLQPQVVDPAEFPAEPPDVQLP